MTPADGLRLLQMRITRHDITDLRLGTRNRHADEIAQEAVQLAQLVTEPQPHVRRDLLVPRAARVQLPAHFLADDLGETALVGGVDVLVVLVGLEGVGGPFVGNLLEAALDFGELFSAQNACLCVGAREGDRPGDVLAP